MKGPGHPLKKFARTLPKTRNRQPPTIRPTATSLGTIGEGGSRPAQSARVSCQLAGRKPAVQIQTVTLTLAALVAGVDRQQPVVGE